MAKQCPSGNPYDPKILRNATWHGWKNYHALVKQGMSEESAFDSAVKYARMAQNCGTYIEPLRNYPPKQPARRPLRLIRAKKSSTKYRNMF